MRVRKFTKARDRKLHNLYTNISGCINTDARFQNNILIGKREVMRLSLYWNSPKFIMNAMQVNVDYSILDIKKACVTFHGYGISQQH